MRVLKRLIGWLVLVPVAVAIVALSVANRDAVMLSFDPVETPPRYFVELPLFLYLFAAVAVGGILASFATWMRQGRWRRRARAEKARTARLEQEVERLQRQLQQATPAQATAVALAPADPARDAA